MNEVEKHLMRAMYGGKVVKIDKNVMKEGEEITDTKICDCNPGGVTPELMKKYIRKAITEIQTLLYLKRGIKDKYMPDIFTYHKLHKDITLEAYHHKKYSKTLNFNGEADSMTVPPTTFSDDTYEVVEE